MAWIDLSDTEIVMLLPPIAAARIGLEQLAARREKQGKAEHASEYRAQSEKLLALWERLRKLDNTRAQGRW